MHGSKLPTLVAIFVLVFPLALTASIAAPSESVLVEAEDYSAMSGIQTQSTSDAGGPMCQPESIHRLSELNSISEPAIQERNNAQTAIRHA